MKVSTFEATVENGIIKLPKDVQLPEKTRAYVVIPGSMCSRHIMPEAPVLSIPNNLPTFSKK